MGSTNAGRARQSRQQIEQELSDQVERAKKKYETSTGEGREAARNAYRHALERFNSFVLEGNLIDED